MGDFSPLYTCSSLMGTIRMSCNLIESWCFLPRQMSDLRRKGLRLNTDALFFSRHSLISDKLRFLWPPSWVQLICWNGSLNSGKYLSLPVYYKELAPSSIVLYFKKITFIYLFIHSYITCVHMQRLEDSLWELILSLRHIDPGDETQIGRLSGKHLYYWANSLDLHFILR